MNDFNLIIFVGMPGAGKSILVDYLKSKGMPSVYFGGITIEELSNRGLEVNPENEKYVREDIRVQEGKGAYAFRIIKQIEKLLEEGNKNIVVDGLYSWTEYKIFKEKFGNKANIIALATPLKVRHSRLANRPERPLSEAEVTKRDYAEIENLEKGGPIANADYYLNNTKGIKELEDQLVNLLNSIGIKIT